MLGTTGCASLLGLAVTCTALTSCSDYLEVEPLTEIIEDKYWNEENDVNNIVMGCYSAMQEEDVVKRMMCWGEFRSDNVSGGTNIENYTDLSNIFKENINANNSFTKWDKFYNIINRCNIVLYYAPHVQMKDPNYTESELNATKAEVSAIRDLMYFYLIRTFRDVPYTTTAYLDDSQEMAVAATPFNAVLDSLITDLESVKDDAVKTWPSTKTDYQNGRITQNAIYAMLADMYLWKQDYQNSVKYADLIIDEYTSDYQKKLDRMAGISSTDDMINGFPLINDKYSTGTAYGYAYYSNFGYGPSRESIFELVYSDNDNMLSNDAVVNLYGNDETFPAYVKPSDFVAGDVTNELYNVFRNKYDARAYEYIQSVSSSLYGINKYVSKSANVKVASEKITADYGSNQSKSHNSSNWIIYRLPDVMLMKAEALAQMVNEGDSTTYGKQRNDSLLSAALNIVNAINKRSCCSSYTELSVKDYNSKTLMTNLVCDERQRELMFEGKRWYDLVRHARRDGNTSYLLEKASHKGSDGGSVIQSKLAKMDAMYWPYYIDELKVNPNLVQNSAFGSGENESYKKN